MRGLAEIQRDNAPKPTKPTKPKSYAMKSYAITIHVSEQVLGALDVLQKTGFFGLDVPSIAEELLRAALLKHADFFRRPR